MSDTREKFEAWWQEYFSKMNAHAFKGHKEVAEHTWLHATAEQDKTIAELNARVECLAKALREIVIEDAGISAGARRMQDLAIDALLTLPKELQLKAKQMKE